MEMSTFLISDVREPADVQRPSDKAVHNSLCTEDGFKHQYYGLDRFTSDIRDNSTIIKHNSKMDISRIHKYVKIMSSLRIQKRII